jgi:hypothetical protein
LTSFSGHGPRCYFIRCKAILRILLIAKPQMCRMLQHSRRVVRNLEKVRITNVFFDNSQPRSFSSSALHLSFLYRHDTRHSESDSSYAHTNRPPTSALPKCPGIPSISSTPVTPHIPSAYLRHVIPSESSPIDLHIVPTLLCMMLVDWIRKLNRSFVKGRSIALTACRPVVVGLLVVHVRLDRRSLA